MSACLKAISNNNKGFDLSLTQKELLHQIIVHMTTGYDIMNIASRN